MSDSQWLRKQIEDAQRTIAEWPEWMKRAAYFDGMKRAETGEYPEAPRRPEEYVRARHAARVERDAARKRTEDDT